MLWAWERTEDLRFIAGDRTAVAYLARSIRLDRDGVRVFGRRHRLAVPPATRLIAVAHIDIDRKAPPADLAPLAPRLVHEIAALQHLPGLSAVQIDFEVLASEQPFLEGIVRAVRAAWTEPRTLSMTALASWCMHEDWIGALPADEIVPMAFRMGRDGDPIRARLGARRSLAQPRCRSALGIAVDELPDRLPELRALYVFNPDPWTPAAYRRVRRLLERP